MGVRHGVIGLLVSVAAWVMAAETPFPVSAARFFESDGRQRIAVAIQVPPGHSLYADMVAVTAEPPARLEPETIPPAGRHLDPVTGEDRPMYTQSVTQHFGVAGIGRDPLTLTVQLQGCAGDLCFLPEEKRLLVDAAGGFRELDPASVSSSAFPRAEAEPVPLRVLARAEGYMAAPAFLAFLKGESATDRGGAFRLEALLAGGGWASLLAILIGGILLNLTPCVLPMIPVNLAIIGAGSHAGSRRRGMGLGLVYGLGMAVAYGALGVLVVLTGAVFGSVNASPGFNLALGLLFVVMALAMFEWITIDLSRFQPARVASARRGDRRGLTAYGVAFGLGGLSAILAGACVAPVVVAVLARAAALYASGSSSGLWLPLVLGLGMALPWPLAGGGMAVLPKPGRWMVWIKRGLGVLILLLAMNYARDAWQGFRYKAGSVSLKDQVEQAVAESDRRGKPLLVDFWAGWCKSCTVMEQTTFRDPSVKQALEAFVVLKLRAERPTDPETKAVLTRFGVTGLPAFVIVEQAR